MRCLHTIQSDLSCMYSISRHIYHDQGTCRVSAVLSRRSGLPQRSSVMTLTQTSPGALSARAYVHALGKLTRWSAKWFCIWRGSPMSTRTWFFPSMQLRHTQQRLLVHRSLRYYKSAWYVEKFSVSTLDAVEAPGRPPDYATQS